MTEIHSEKTSGKTLGNKTDTRTIRKQKVLSFTLSVFIVPPFPTLRKRPYEVKNVPNVHRMEDFKKSGKKTK